MEQTRTRAELEKDFEDTYELIADVLSEHGADTVGPNLLALLRMSSVLIASATDRDEFDHMLETAVSVLERRAREYYGDAGTVLH
jgi:hypothetical protein